MDTYEYGASPDAKGSLDETPLHMSLSRPFGSDGDGPTALGLMTISKDLNARDALGNTPLHGAAVNAGAAHIRALLATKAVEPDARNQENLTPLLSIAKE